MAVPTAASSVLTPSHSGLHNQHVDLRMFHTSGTDITTSIASAISAMSAGQTLFIPSAASSWTVTSVITVNKSIAIRSNGAKITTSATGAALFSVTASDVSIEGLELVGRGTGTYVAGERGVSLAGTDGSTPIARVSVKNCYIHGFGQYGIRAAYVTDIHLSGNTISNVGLGGIAVLSGLRGHVSGNTIRSVTPGLSGDTYGITLTREETDSLVTDPMCEDISVVGNQIRDSVGNEGIDMHGGLNCTIAANIIRGAVTGISVAAVENAGGVATWAPKGVTISGNTITSGVTDGSYSTGISVIGAGSIVGTVVDYATGLVVGNFVDGHGNDSAGQTIGAITCYYTDGMVVAGNSVRNAAGCAISMYHDNRGFVVADNVSLDPWTTAAASSFSLGFGSGYNLGFVGGNAWVRGDRAGAHVNELGIFIQNTAGQSIVLGINRSDATTALSDAGNNATGLDFISSSVLRAYQEVKVHKQQNAATVARVRNDIALGNTAASAQLQLESKDSSGFVAAFPSDYSVSGLQDRAVLGANSDASGVTVYAGNANQDIRLHAGGTTEYLRVTSAGSVVAHPSGATATNATDGFLYIPTCAGTPTGVPTSVTGTVPIIFDTTNTKLYIYTGGSWKGGTTPGAFV